MTNLEILWDYQQADVAVDRMQSEIKRSPVRQKLVKCRDNLEEQQTVYKRIESEIAIMTDRLDALKDAMAKADTQYKALQTKVESSNLKDLEELRKLIAEAKKIKDNMASIEQEINKIKKDAVDREKQQHDVKMRYAKYKNEFTTLKATYDEEYGQKTKELDALKAVAKEKEKDVQAQLLARYQQIKKHSFPPLAKLTGDKCGGCNMSLPSGAVRGIKAGEFSECETCGRLVML